MSGKRLGLVESSRLLLFAPVLVISALVSVLVLFPMRSAQAAPPPRLFFAPGHSITKPVDARRIAQAMDRVYQSGLRT